LFFWGGGGSNMYPGNSRQLSGWAEARTDLGPNSCIVDRSGARPFGTITRRLFAT
jgi:hypothetical protein